MRMVAVFNPGQAITRRDAWVWRMGGTACARAHHGVSTALTYRRATRRNAHGGHAPSSTPTASSSVPHARSACSPRSRCRPAGRWSAPTRITAATGACPPPTRALDRARRANGERGVDSDPQVFGDRLQLRRASRRKGNSTRPASSSSRSGSTGLPVGPEPLEPDAKIPRKSTQSAVGQAVSALHPYATYLSFLPHYLTTSLTTCL